MIISSFAKESWGLLDSLWQLAGSVQELTPLFQGSAPQMPPMPNV